MSKRNSKRVFTPTLYTYNCFIFRSGYSLRNHLVRAKVYPLIRKKGTFYCGKSRCETCCNIKQTDTFESFVTKRVYKINHSFNCDSKCLIYLFSFLVFKVPQMIDSDYKSC